MRFFYDSTGKRVGFANGTMLFYYLYNLQGDVIAIVRAATGQVVAKYTYDAWGNCTVTNAAGYTVGDKNPFRYRGYYYDTETGLYYLNSRYYNPEFGRFISADTPDVITVSPDSAFWDKNLFAYCDGNPVTRVDDCGEFWHFIAGAAVGGLISGISTAISGGSARDIVISAVGGALSGALSASGVGLVGQILGNAAISASSNIATQISDYYSGRRQTFNEKELVADTVWGGVSGVVSGAGATKEFGKKHMTLDIKDEFEKLLSTGKTSQEITDEMLAEYRSIIGDIDEEPLFWFALADTQWNWGVLLPPVKQLKRKPYTGSIRAAVRSRAIQKMQ